MVVKPFFPFGAEGLHRTLCHKHTNSPFLVDHPGVYQQVDALEGCGGVDLIQHGKLCDGGDLAFLREGPREDAVLQPFGDLLENRLFRVEIQFHGCLLS